MLLLGALLALSLPGNAAMAKGNSIRPPAVAGKFYSSDAHRLEQGIRDYLAQAKPPSAEKPVAIVVPHAGYVYSGQIAADAYAQAKGGGYDLVVILGTNHTVHGFDGVSVYDGDGYRTPLGVAKIDREVAQKLIFADRSFSFRPEVHAREHSVEVQVPFVQVTFPGVPIVTAVVGAPDVELCTRFGQALARVLKGRHALIVASSDLSHYPTEDVAISTDRTTLEAIAQTDPAALHKVIRKQMAHAPEGLVTCACGEAPIMAALAAAKAMGAGKARVISYANSGDCAVGDPGRVVGYGAVAIFPGKGPADLGGLERPAPPAKAEPIGAADRRELLHLARKTLEQYLTTETAPLPRPPSPRLWFPQGAFVTLEKHGQLRGCIGHMAEDRPLCQVVASMALAAGLNDHRFSPVTAAELDDLEIEISVLTPFARVSGPEAIEIGRDGVVLAKNGRRAVFLPQVAPEQGWDLVQTLDHLCRKAGMETGCWRSGAEFFTFQAEVFSEASTRGGKD